MVVMVVTMRAVGKVALPLLPPELCPWKKFCLRSTSLRVRLEIQGRKSAMTKPKSIPFFWQSSGWNQNAVTGSVRSRYMLSCKLQRTVIGIVYLVTGGTLLVVWLTLEPPYVDGQKHVWVQGSLIHNNDAAPTVTLIRSWIHTCTEEDRGGEVMTLRTACIREILSKKSFKHTFSM